MTASLQSRSFDTTSRDNQEREDGGVSEHTCMSKRPINTSNKSWSRSVWNRCMYPSNQQERTVSIVREGFSIVEKKLTKIEERDGLGTATSKEGEQPIEPTREMKVSKKETIQKHDPMVQMEATVDLPRNNTFNLRDKPPLSLFSVRSISSSEIVIDIMGELELSISLVEGGNVDSHGETYIHSSSQQSFRSSTASSTSFKDPLYILCRTIAVSLRFSMLYSYRTNRNAQFYAGIYPFFSFSFFSFFPR